ncbi:ataxin-7-like [Thrips palmi]|uniref:Ataxin-7-like n=1 Tax=Thrips palmi TaxID=161013 RepID=A0A6P8XWU6_THRPL|nr:ataxin-7-like [Thrips palmi]
MASSRKSLSDFFGLSWSSWSEYSGEFANTDGAEEEKTDSRRKSSDVMRLFSSDMQKFGLFPETDCFCTVVCSECNALVKPQGLLSHMRVRHKELVPGKISPEKVSKFSESSSIKSIGDKSSAKHALNEKLMSKLILNEKHKPSSEKLLSSPGDKHKASLEKSSVKYSSSEKASQKASDKFLGKSTSDKISRNSNEKVKAPLDKSLTGPSLLTDKALVKNESDKVTKTGIDSTVCNLKSIKLGDKPISKPVSEKPSSKYASPDNKIFSLNERHLSKSGEKISVKSVLSEKLLSKVAANEKIMAANEKSRNFDFSRSDNGLKKGDSLLKPERMVTKPVMKSLLKEKVLRNEAALNIVPGTSLLRPIVQQDRELPQTPGPGIGITTLSPPVLTPQNLTPERHQSATDMPVLSRKRKYKERKAPPTQYDPDRHCGVWCDYFNKFCVRSLTCKVHSVALRRAVVGRSKPFDQLLSEHKRAKEDQRQSKEDQDDISEPSPHLSDRLHSPSEPSNSSFVSSPCISPASSPAPSPSENVFLSNVNHSDEAVALVTPSTATNPPVPLPSYQYPPYPPPESACSSPPRSMVSLSPHLSSPLLNVALPSLIPSHAPRPPDTTEDDSTKCPRTVARAINRLQLNKGKQFNVKHTAFPPKPLRTCLFQGRKSSGMFFVQRELESMRAGFRLSVKGNKPMPQGHVPSTSQSLPETAIPHLSVTSDSVFQSSGTNVSPQVNTASSLKSVLSSLCSPKAVLNSQQRGQRPQKAVVNCSDSSIQQPISSDSSLTINSDKLPQGMRISVPTTIPQQIAYLTTSTPVTFQQVPIINSQVLSQLQLQSKGAGGTLKLLSTGGGGRTLLVHQYQDGSGAES